MECNPSLQGSASKHTIFTSASMQLGLSILPTKVEGVLQVHEHEIYRRCKEESRADTSFQNQWMASILEEILN